MFTAATVFSALELGFIYALVAMALFLSFRMLKYRRYEYRRHLYAGLRGLGYRCGGRAPGAGAVSGHCRRCGLPALSPPFLQTRLGVPSILAGIITNTGLYTVNLAVMGFSSNVPMLKTPDDLYRGAGAFRRCVPVQAAGGRGHHRGGLRCC